MRTFLNPQKETRRHKLWLIREIKLSQKFPTTPVSYIFQRQYRKKKRHTQLFFRVFKIFEQSYRYKFFSDITDMEHTEWKLWQNIFKEFLPFSASMHELPFLTGNIFLAEDSSSDFSLPLEWYSSTDRQAPPTKIESQWNIKTLKCWCCLLLWVLEDLLISYLVAVTCGRHGKRISRFAVATEFLILITFMSFSQTGVLHKRFTRWDAGCRW